MDEEFLKECCCLADDSQTAHEKSLRFASEARSKERELVTKIFANHGIILGKTVVRNLETDAVGILYLDSQTSNYYLTFHNIAFYKLKKNGEPSRTRSFADSIHHNNVNSVGYIKINGAGDKNYYTHDGKRIERGHFITLGVSEMAKCYEVVGEPKGE